MRRDPDRTTLPPAWSSKASRLIRGIQRQPLHATVVDALREMIQSCEMPPGSKINEGELCRLLDVSRTPLREALKILAAEGLVELRPRRGARVAAVERVTIAAIFEVMGALERLIGQLACLKATDAELAEIGQLHGRLVELHRKGSRRAYFKLNRQIHNRLVTLARNAALEASYAGFSVRLTRARALANFDRTRWQASIQEHGAIMDALRARDADLLAARLEAHNRLTGEAVVAALERLDTPDAPPRDTAEIVVLAS
jgi:DNA-binding GntR family transcriptional regulator